METGVLSIVIPALNEGARIAQCLNTLAPLRKLGAQIIVCDGYSTDDTAEIAHRHGAQLVCCARGRARQMNAGAAASSARMLAFLHADTRVDDRICERLWALANGSSQVWGRFDVRLSGPGIAFRVIETCMNARSRLTGIATGDQLIFCSTALFHEVGGFAEIDLMEDVQLSTSLRRVRRPVCCAERVHTSSRKWRSNGIMRTVFLMWRLRLAYALGADPSRLAKIYTAQADHGAATAADER